MQTIDKDAANIRAWLEDVMAQTGLKPTPLAKRAGLAPSTILRALDPDNPSTLERSSIARIARALGVAAPGVATAVTGADFAIPAADDTPDDIPANQYVRLVASRALALAGYLPGDLVTLDMSTPPIADDVVDAQVYSLDRHEAQTVFRLYDPPYLVTRTADPSAYAKPLLVDGERVRIAAVVVRMQRWPRKRSS